MEKGRYDVRMRKKRKDDGKRAIFGVKTRKSKTLDGDERKDYGMSVVRS